MSEISGWSAVGVCVLINDFERGSKNRLICHGTLEIYQIYCVPMLFQWDTMTDMQEHSSEVSVWSARPPATGVCV